MANTQQFLDTSGLNSFYGKISPGLVSFVKGTQTASTNAWTGEATYGIIPEGTNKNEIPEGTTIAYFLPYAGTSSGATLTLKLPNGNTTAALPIYYSGTTRVTTHVSANSLTLMTYVKTDSSNANPGWRVLRSYYQNDNTVPAIHCSTAAAAKVGTCTNYVLLDKSYFLLNLTSSNTAASALTLNVNSRGAKTIYINGVASSATNYTLPAGMYIGYYDAATGYHVRTDGQLPTLDVSLHDKAFMQYDDTDKCIKFTFAN